MLLEAGTQIGWQPPDWIVLPDDFIHADDLLRPL